MRLKRMSKFSRSVTKGLLPTQQATLSQVVCGMLFSRGHGRPVSICLGRGSKGLRAGSCVASSSSGIAAIALGTGLDPAFSPSLILSSVALERLTKPFSACYDGNRGGKRRNG
jgi:hypothetical protein